MTSAIIIKKNTKVKSVILKNISKASDININNADVVSIFNSNIKKSKNFKLNFKRYCDWELDDYVISIFGSKKGKAGSENKFDLPPPEDVDIYFGEILIVKSSNNIIQDLNIDDFNTFIESSFGGFEDLGSKDTEEEYDPELDKYESDFVVDDNEILYDEDYNPEEDEEDEYESSTNEENNNPEEDEEDEYESSTNEENNNTEEDDEDEYESSTNEENIKENEENEDN